MKYKTLTQLNLIDNFLFGVTLGYKKLGKKVTRIMLKTILGREVTIREVFMTLEEYVRSEKEEERKRAEEAEKRADMAEKMIVNSILGIKKARNCSDEEAMNIFGVAAEMKDYYKALILSINDHF